MEAYDVRGDASNQQIGIILDGVPVPQEDLDAFSKATGVPRLRQGTSGPDTVHWNTVDPTLKHDTTKDGRAELAADVEYAHGMAWHSHIEVWLVPTLSPVYLKDALRQAVRSHVTIFSNSWRLPNWDGAVATQSRGYYQEIEASLRAATRVHKTFFFGSGDNGIVSGCDQVDNYDTCPIDPHKHVRHAAPPFPAESPNVVAVGGTVLSPDSARASDSGDHYSETGWRYSGGGCSLYFSIPSWQNTLGSSAKLNPCDEARPFVHRVVPDVAAIAAATPQGQGALIWYDGHRATYTGTSLATPVWAGMAADLEHYLSVHHKPSTGFMAPGIYRLATNATTYSRDFHDIIAFAPDMPDPDRGIVPGWDDVTGWGSPDLAHLEEDWAATDGGQRIYVSPRIDAVHFGGAGRNLRIVITGKDFGSAPRNLPYTGDLCCAAFSIRDLTRQWEAGGNGDPVTLRYASWNDGRIVIDGFAGAYGRGHRVAMPGDRVEIHITDVAMQHDTTWRGTLPSAASISPVPDRGKLTTVVMGLDQPEGVAVDRTGAVYIADAGGAGGPYADGRVVKVRAGGGKPTIVATGLPVAAGVAVDSKGTVYLAIPEINSVVKVPVSGGKPTIVVTDVLYAPDGVAMDRTGAVYISEFTGRVIKVPAGGGKPIIVVTGLDHPEAVAVDSTGTVYIADIGPLSEGNSGTASTNGRVVKVPAGGGKQTTVARGLYAPDGVTVNRTGTVYITDSQRGRVVKVPARGGKLTTVVTGLSDPNGVAVDHTGAVYIADTGHNRVVKVSARRESQAAGSAGLFRPSRVG